MIGLQLTFDQLSTVAYQQQACIHNTGPWSDPHHAPSLDDFDIESIICSGIDSNSFFTQKQLQKLADWQDWKTSEYKQLSSCHEQGMFGDPYPTLADRNIMNLL